MNYTSKLIVSFFNFITFFWLIFYFQLFLEIKVAMKFLSGISLMISALLTYLISKKRIDFNPILKYSLISYAIGFILGFIFIAIFDPNEAQGIFLSILWTGPISWLIGMSFFVFKARKPSS